MGNGSASAQPRGVLTALADRAHGSVLVTPFAAAAAAPAGAAADDKQAAGDKQVLGRQAGGKAEGGRGLLEGGAAAAAGPAAGAPVAAPEGAGWFEQVRGCLWLGCRSDVCSRAGTGG